MKYFVLFCILIIALPGFGQQDSIVYEKLKNGGLIALSVRMDSSGVYTKDSLYYRIKFSRTSEVLIIKIESFTDVDSLMGRVLFGEYTDASRQYKEAILESEAAEKGYELRLRQAERQYLEFTGKRIKDKVEENFEFDQILGDWLLNDKPIKIDSKLEIDKKPIKILSEVQFTVEIDKERRVFNRINKTRWQADGGKYVLARPKEKAKKKAK